MNQIAIYQHPFVDIFQAFKVIEWDLAHKEGDVSKQYDRQLAKCVIKIAGATPQSNYIQVPATKNLPKKALGLIGKYIYLQLNVPAGKTFAVHLDYCVNDARTVRMSFSNLYKEHKNMNGTSIQVPLAQLPQNRWVLICVDAAQILSENQVFAAGQPEKYFLRSFQVCATVSLKGIYTSDIQYTVTSLPKAIAYKMTPPATDWFQEFAWIQIPEKALDHQIEHSKGKENSTKKSNLKRPKTAKNDDKNDKKSVIIHQQNESNDAAAEAYQAEVDAIKQAEAERRKREQDELVALQMASVERTNEEVDQIKLAYDMTLKSKHIDQTADVKMYQNQEFYDPNKSQRRNCEKFLLKPDPILGLDRVLGVQPRHFCAKTFFNQDPKLSSEIFYSQANCIVGYHHQTQKQRLFLDCRVSEITNLWATRNALVSVSESPNGKLLKSGAPAMDQLVALWDTDEAEVTFTFKPPFMQIKTCDVSKDQSAMALSGKDLQGRDLIIVYSFQELFRHRKIELLARQLCDFQLESLKFVDGSDSTLVGCGKENIRIFKIKNNFLPAQIIQLNNLARDKVFSNSAVIFNENKKVKHLFVSTDDGCLFFVNFYSRQVDKVVQIYDKDRRIQSLVPGNGFYLTASRDGALKLWSSDFSRIVSEVAINQEIGNCDINVNLNEIAVLSTEGTLSLLELDSNSFKVLMRSHQADLIGSCHNAMANAVVTAGKDSAIKVWDAESLTQIHEFTTALTDPPTKIISSPYDDTVAVGFKSGFLRFFALGGPDKQMTHESMIFESPIMDIAFSKCGKFAAAFYKIGKIVIFNIEQGDCRPVKNIEYDYPGDYFSLDFSPCSSYLANISSNANNITIWETKNFSLRWHVDLTGDLITKIQFAPNNQDLLALTTTSKLKYLRVNPLLPEIEIVRDQHGLTDATCQDFQISPNNKFIACCGKDGQIKIYDYFMRGEVLAAQQAFTGHLICADKICFYQENDMRYLLSVGEGNGLYRWTFYGDKKQPDDLLNLYEKTAQEIQREERKEQNQEITHPTFDQNELGQYTEQQLAEKRQNLIDQRDENSAAPISQQYVQRPHQDLLKDGGLSLTRQPKIEYTPAGYTFEEHDISLSKVLGCSIRPRVGNNLEWDRRNGSLIYSMENVLIWEQLSQEKTQMLKQEVNDVIHEIKISPDQNLVLAFTKSGALDGKPQIIVWNTNTRRKVSQVAIDDEQIQCAHFSNYSNMLLVISYSVINKRSTIAVWDFHDGRQDFFCKSVVPFKVLDARWNPYMKQEGDEFVTIADDCYHYWRITEHLQMQYQPGKQPKSFEGSLTAISFVEPMNQQNSVYLLIGLSSGCVWVMDTRGNYWLHSAKILDCPVRKLISSVSRIIVEGSSDQHLHSWELKKTIADFDYDASNPDYFFAGPEQQLSLDGFPSASSYDATAAEAILVSSANSFWLVNFIEGVTVKIKSCHSPTAGLRAVDFKYVTPNEFKPTETQDQGYQFDQNYLVGTTGFDGIIKLWNMYDVDHLLNFIVPKEECVSIAMHQFKSYMIAGFTDGYLRFFDIQEGRTLGRCLINTSNEEAPEVKDYVTNIRILPSGTHVLCSTKYGQIVLVFVETWAPLGITIHNLASLNTSMNSFDVSYLEPYNKWLAAACNGKIMVYNRQDSNSFKQELFDIRQPPTFTFMDSFNVQEYVDNCFTETKRVNTLDHFYSLSKRNLVFNEASKEHETEARFLNNDLASYICFVRKCNSLFIRNFELHQVVRKIDFDARAITMEMAPGSAPYIYMILESKELWLLDFVNENNVAKTKTLHDAVTTLKVCPNGRYVLTSGNAGDIALWSVKRRRNQMGMQIAKDSFA